jgi:muconolactone delta-isomerase
MEYLVTMTTHVPGGTSEETIQDTRAREATRSRELAEQGHLLRLWRPPLRPGEWRTLGLFVAADDEELEEVLSSMPLRVWRMDQAMPLAAHPNDPAHLQPDFDYRARTRDSERAVEFLTTFTIDVPDGTPRRTVDDTAGREASRVRELADQGHLLRLWALPGEWKSLGLWQAEDAPGLQAMWSRSLCICG